MNFFARKDSIELCKKCREEIRIEVQTCVDFQVRFAPLHNVCYNFVIASVTDLPLAAKKLFGMLNDCQFNYKFKTQS